MQSLWTMVAPISSEIWKGSLDLQDSIKGRTLEENSYPYALLVSPTKTISFLVLQSPSDVKQTKQKTRKNTQTPTQYRPLDSKTRTTTRTRFFNTKVVRVRQPASFWRENARAVVILLTILLRVLARMS